jgi:dipeptidyl aminopeptidase/acylaminoacyl peptidase
MKYKKDMQTNTSPSPIPLETLNRFRRFNDVRLNFDGRSIYWIESINGRGSLMRLDADGGTQDLSADHDIRGGVGYGGGEFDVNSAAVAFADSGGALFGFRSADHGETHAITPAWGGAAAPALSPKGDWVLYVYQQGETNGLAICRTHGLTWPVQLALGADFYMQPAWHPSGEMIAWVEWNHPYMPWDAGRVKLGQLGGMQLRLLEEQWLDGGAGAPASQPQFSPDGKWLSYVQRDGDWDSLVLYNLKRHQRRVLQPAAEGHLVQPAWVQGMRSYAWAPDSRSIYYFRYFHGSTSLWQVNLRSGKSKQLSIEPVCWAEQLDCAAGEDSDVLVFLGSTGRAPKQIWRLDEEGLTCAVANALDGVPAESISLPQEIRFKSAGDSEVFGIYYPPAASEQTQTAPALILDIHGGPTGADPLCFSNEAAFFTSRGYAYTRINYRGSSGYGYAYQDALRESWGIVDVEDTLHFAEELVRRGLADPKRLVIKGSSAGGFTALNVLIQKPGMFKASICSYAVGDLVDDAQHTHKFEKYYHRFLTGNFERDYQRFVDRSPIFHVEGIRDPVALFHGDSDKVVSPSQSEQIYAQLSRRGVPCTLKIYAGEGHGFRQPENVADFYQSMLDFLEKHLGKNSATDGHG